MRGRAASADLPRPASGSWWLEEALALPEFAGPETPPLQGDRTADVVIIGGGYTGMWTAYFLKEREPGIDVVLLEQGICGGGPSGRNGGFLNAFYDDLGTLVERYGEEGRRTAQLAAHSIDEIGAWCERRGVDAWYAMTGDIGISTNPTHDAIAIEVARGADELGIGDVYRPLSQAEVRTRFDSPVARSGVHVRHAEHVQPARLARGLRRVLLEQGVRVFEGSPVRRFAEGRDAVRVETPAGSVRAGSGVNALGAYVAGLGAFRRSILPRGSYIVMSASAPEALERMGWTGGEGVYDFRSSLHYLRTTPDGRIAFGGASSRTGLGTGLGPRLAYDPASIGRLVRDFRTWFPTFEGVPLEAGWGGPIDLTGLHIPFFGTLPGGRIHFGVGYTGGGVGPCHLGGKILASLTLGVEDEHTTLPLVGAEPRRFPREPLRSLGALVAQTAIVAKDDAEDGGRRPNVVVEQLARLPGRLGYRLGP